MFTIPLEYSGKRFWHSCPVCGSLSWDPTGHNFRCCCCDVRMFVTNDTYFHQILLYVQDSQVDSSGDAPCRPEK